MNVKLNLNGVGALLLSFLGFSNCGFALDLGHSELIGSLGSATLNPGSSQVTIAPSEIDKLMQNTSNSWSSFTQNVGYGFIFYPNNERYAYDITWFPSIEPQINFYNLDNSNNLTGTVLRFGNPALNDYTYKITIHTIRLMIDTAVTLVAWKNFSLYGLFGFGNARNTINYSDQNNPITKRLNLNSKTKSQLAWETGLGMRVEMNDNYSITLQYLYADLGSAIPAIDGSALTVPAVIVPPEFKVNSQAVFLGLRVAI